MKIGDCKIKLRLIKMYTDSFPIIRIQAWKKQNSFSPKQKQNACVGSFNYSEIFEVNFERTLIFFFE